jgi:transposase-like protein
VVFWEAEEATRVSKKAHTEEQILRALRQAESGTKVADICREHGVSEATYSRHRPAQYLKNILEQDHRAIKRRVKAKQGFREFHAARRTLAGYEAIHVIRKGQARRVSAADVRR